MKERNYDILLDEYVEKNGHHFNESLAKRVVSGMWHEDANKKRIEGEAVSPSDAMRLLDGMDADKREKMKWDAYVAANAFKHDLAGAMLNDEAVMKAAKLFWFHDDDMDDGCHKVFWYFFK